MRLKSLKILFFILTVSLQCKLMLALVTVLTIYKVLFLNCEGKDYFACSFKKSTDILLIFYFSSLLNFFSFYLF